MPDSTDSCKILIARASTPSSVGLNFGPVPSAPVPPAAPSTPSRWEREARSNERALITEDLGLHPHDYDVPFLDHWPTDFPCDVAVTLYSRTRRQRMWGLYRGAGKMVLVNNTWYGVKPK